MKFLAKFAMCTSFLYYTLEAILIWGGQLFGLHNEIWDVFDHPVQPFAPPLWTLLIGAFVSFAGLISLALAYQAIWRTLNGGAGQSFRDLATHLKRIAVGLIGFWLSYNILSGVVIQLVTINVADTSNFDFSWDPLDLDIIFLIVAIALLAISQTLERAWVAEEENQQFV